MGKLKEWADEQSRFLRIGDGEEATVKFIDFEVMPSTFDPDKNIVRYVFEVNGSNKTFDSASGVLARYFDAIKKGSWVKISRVGEGMKTNWSVEEVKSEDVNPEDVNV